jgi:micrococcal nuclease
MTTRRALRLFSAVVLVLAIAAAHFATTNATQPSTPQVAAAAEVTATTTPPAGQANTYFVQKVVDGDTLDISINGTTTRLRLIGMDTPEVVDPRKPVQCFGKEASAEGHKLLENQWIRLEYDAVAGVHDKYGRILVYVFLPDGTLYNEFMIRQGFAHEYDYDNQKYKYRTRFQAAQTAAKSAQLGFWSPSTCDGNTTKPAGAK